MSVHNAIFDQFLQNNPLSSISHRDAKQDGKIAKLPIIKDPWGDSTLLVDIPIDEKDSQALADAINSLYLPNSFSAIVHRDTSQLEVIWTAYKLKEASAEVVGRDFVFSFLGRDRQCRFARASDRLLTLAKYCVPCSIPTSTEHRNIVSLHFFSAGMELPNIGDPISFYVDCEGISDERMVDFVKHLNAFMSYFDHKTPRILIHEGDATPLESPRSRYINGSFPARIEGRSIDPNLMSYWLEMVATKNEIMKFLLCYRIIEYASFNYIEPNARAKIKKLIKDPSAMNDLDRLVGLIVETSAIAKGLDEIPRTETLLAGAVDPNLLWGEISRCKPFFSSPTRFEGGFEVKNLVTISDSFEGWAVNGIRNTLDRLRQIRNALAHGQDTKTRATILPSQANSRMIRPWLNLIEIMAGETMLYRDVV